MWLRKRPNVTSSVARSWYTHACAERLKKHIRRFTGKVSKASLLVGADLRLEHHLRIQTTLTQLIERHYTEGICDENEFISTVMRCEEVHIVTAQENYAAMRARGDYESAGIELIDWELLDGTSQLRLWNKILRYRVCNYLEYEPIE